jgi:hypothetical protein
LPLDKLATPATAILHNVPVTMLFASLFLYLRASAVDFSPKIADFSLE